MGEYDDVELTEEMAAEFQKLMDLIDTFEFETTDLPSEGMTLANFSQYAIIYHDRVIRPIPKSLMGVMGPSITSINDTLIRVKFPLNIAMPSIPPNIIGYSPEQISIIEQLCNLYALVIVDLHTAAILSQCCPLPINLVCVNPYNAKSITDESVKEYITEDYSDRSVLGVVDYTEITTPTITAWDLVEDQLERQTDDASENESVN